jgi:MYXO-CTERM domain-containing protein
MKTKHVVTVGTFVGLALAATAAHAQALRPNILILQDTSTSMLENSAGQGQNNDGSPLCNNNAGGQTTRIYNMKNAIRAALAQVGTDEANFGLARFPQIENTATTNCPSAHWSSGGNSTSVGGNTGCRLSTQNSNQTAYDPTTMWFDNGIGQALLVPVTRPATGLKALAPADYDPLGANITSVYKWIDQADSGMTGAANPDPELRIPNGAYTPLGRSMFYSRLYFENYVYPNDPKKACRQNILIIATDGAETCDNVPNGTTIDPTSCVQTPTNTVTFNPLVQACLTRHSTVIPKGVLVYILTDSGLSTTDKAAASAIAAAGGTGQAIFVSLTDTTAVKQALVDIIAKTVPPAEVCNGIDDNCNGLIDEGVSNLCAVANPNDPNDPDNKLGVNALHCAVETCNCKDDNCNGQVDEGFPPNACGQPCGCAVPKEICNGLDDNCDGQIDEGFMVGASCMTAGVGACKRSGILVCTPDGSGTYCDAPTVMPQPEVCNGIDDDCDGQIDNGTLPGVGEKCGNSLGTCQSGTFVCTNGQLVCNAVGNPMPEICNGIDDNCDGVIDNGNFPDNGKPCLCPGLTQAEVDVGGVCKAGHLVCRGALGFVCEGCVLPTTEICNGLDNNCDGMIDTAGMCPSGFGCRDGQCTLQCVGGEFPCPAGYKCVNQFCVPQRCASVTCPSGQKCDENTGTCVDACQGVVCPAPTICVAAGLTPRCIDCNDPSLACTAPQICVAGKCQDDPCLNVNCASGQYCDNGTCKDLCIPGKCAAGERCVAGNCITDPCSNVPCGDKQFCNPQTGMCETDKCLGTLCGPGKACVSMTNTCENDPCLTMRCPSDCWTCKVQADGSGSCVVDNDKCQQINITVGQKSGGSNGCACEVGDSGGSFAPLGLMLGLGLVVSRRRRRR